MTKGAEDLRALLDEAEREGLIRYVSIRRQLERMGYDNAVRWLAEEREVQKQCAELRQTASDLVSELNTVLEKYKAKIDLRHWSGCVVVEIPGVSRVPCTLDFDQGRFTVKD